MSPDAAKKFLDLAFRHDRDWNELLFELQDSCDPVEFKKLKLIVGHILATHFEQILVPIQAQHPELIPPGIFD